MKTSEILIKAKKRLAWSNKELIRNEFICNAIEVSSSHPKANLLIKEISNRMGGKQTMRLWLNEVHGISWHALNSKNLQAHRHAWVDMLIEEYQAKGD